MTSAQDTNAPTILTGVGMQVTSLSPEQVAVFRKQAQPAVVAWVKEQVGEEWVDKLFTAIEVYRQANY
jgi:hypothetical protein